jgi:hypothetical protein
MDDEYRQFALREPLLRVPNGRDETGKRARDPD